MLNCLYFSLTQNEFKLKDVKTSDVFLKLDLNKIRKLFMNKIEKDESEFDENVDINLYVQVNNKLVRKIKLVDLLKHKNNENNEDKNENRKVLSNDNSNENDEDININNTKEIEISTDENIDKSSNNNNNLI